MAQKISTGIKNTFGYDVPVLVKRDDAMKTIIADHPFTNEVLMDTTKLHVTYLDSPSAVSSYEAISNKLAEGEAFWVTASVVYLYCPNGYGTTKLTNTFLEKHLKVGATTRNWKTSLELLRIAELLDKA